MKRNYIKPTLVVEEYNSIIDFADMVSEAQAGDSVITNAWNFWK